MEDDRDGGSRAPIDRGALVRILDRVRITRQMSRAYLTLRHSEPCLVVEYDLDVYPPGVDDAYLTIRWYRNDDFGVHYHETWERSSWDCRWDRHPNQHNTDDHFHPPPDAPTPGQDTSYPDGLHDHKGTYWAITTDEERHEAYHGYARATALYNEQFGVEDREEWLAHAPDDPHPSRSEGEE